MSIGQTDLRFPSRTANVRSLWAPLLFCPRPGSPERLVIGVAAANQDGFYLAEGNAWRRLHCLFDADADTALLTVRVAFERMRQSLAANGTQGFEAFEAPFTGISLGEVREGEASSVRALAELWLSESSSLYDPTLTEVSTDGVSASGKGVGSDRLSGDRLPILVREYVQQRRPGLAQAFSSEYQSMGRRSRVPAQRVRIAFSGSLLVANFATLPARRSKTTIEHIKSLVLDLETDRELDSMRDHKRWEMIVQHQDRDDPHILPYQFEAVLGVLDELGEQARVRDLVMLPYTSVPQIGSHLIEREQRVAA